MKKGKRGCEEDYEERGVQGRRGERREGGARGSGKKKETGGDT